MLAKQANMDVRFCYALDPIPDAKLYALGNFDDPKWKKLVSDRGLENNVIFCGMVKDINRYYEKASSCRS